MMMQRRQSDMNLIGRFQAKRDKPQSRYLHLLLSGKREEGVQQQ
jgi:hypothetical protein